MDLLQLGSLLGSIVLLVGLVRAHRYIVREYVVENVTPPEEEESEA